MRPGKSYPILHPSTWVALLVLLAACSDPAQSVPVVAGLDLAVTGVTGPADAPEGSTVGVHVIVENVGTVATTTATVRFDLGAAGSPGSEVDRVVLPSLAPGATHAFDHALVLPAAMASGQYQIIAVVEATGDGVHANDSGTLQFHVTSSSCAPDASEDNDLWSAAKPLVLESSRFVNFCDDGIDWFSFSGTAGTEIGLLIDSPSALLAYSIVRPDGMTAISTGFASTRTTFTPDANGTYFLAVQVFPTIDAMGVPHSGVGPNTDYEIRILTPVPDLAGSNLYAASSVPQGGVSTVTAYVENLGFTTSTSASLGLFLSTDATVTKDDLRIGSATLPPVVPYGTTSVDFTVVFAPALVGTYYVGAIVDEDGLAVDFDRNNNLTQVQALTLVANTCTPDAHEADDTAAQAVPLPISTPVTLNHCEDLFDWLAIDLVGGVEYAITMTPGSSGVVPGLVVVDPDGTTVLADEHDGQLFFVAPATGTYFLDATDTWDMSTRARIGTNHDYAVMFEERLPDFAPSLSYLYPTSTVAGGIVEYDYAFTNVGTTVGGPHRIGIYLSTDSSVTTADRLLLSIDGTALPLTGTGRVASSIYLPHDVAPGIYSIAAIADDLNQVKERDETNNVVVPQMLTVEASTCVRDAYEFDDALGNATSVVFGTPQSHNFCDDGTDWIAFTANAGDDVLLHFATTSFVLGRLEIFDGSGTSLVGPSPATENDLFFEAPAAGTFYARIGNQPSTYYTTGPRDYQVLVGACAKDAKEDNDFFTSAASFTVGQTASLNFCDDYEDWFAFQAVSGVQYVIATGSLGTNVDTRLELQNASGAFLASNDNINGGTQASRITWTAPSTGTYYVKASTWFNQWGFGSTYTLSIQ